MTDRTRNSCGVEVDAVEYLFGETSEDERSRFDEHLISCESCIEEFAALSEARYAIYEWKSVEFDSLTTPSIVIPKESKVTSLSWFNSLKAAFTLRPGLVAAEVSLAVLAAAAFFGFFVVSDSTPDNDLVLVANTTSANTLAPEPPARTETERDIVGTTAKAREPLNSQASTARSDRNPTAVNSTITPAQNQKRRIRSIRPQNRPTPTLSGFDETEDRSLRLTELFDDLDTIEME